MKNCLTEKEAAEYIGMSQAYLRLDRKDRTRNNRTPGPSFLRIGRSIRYLKADLDNWLEQYRVERG